MSNIENKEKIRWYTNPIQGIQYYPLFAMLILAELIVVWELWSIPMSKLDFNMLCIIGAMGILFLFGLIYLSRRVGLLSIGISSSALYLKYGAHIEQIPWREIEKIVPLMGVRWEGGKRYSKTRSQWFAVVLNTNVIILPRYIVGHYKFIDEIIVETHARQKGMRE